MDAEYILPLLLPQPLSWQSCLVWCLPNLKHISEEVPHHLRARSRPNCHLPIQICPPLRQHLHLLRVPPTLPLCLFSVAFADASPFLTRLPLPLDLYLYGGRTSSSPGCEHVLGLVTSAPPACARLL